jgi:hypothetical protein
MEASPYYDVLQTIKMDVPLLNHIPKVIKILEHVC